MNRPAATLALCTYNRATLLARVLKGCFEQTVGDYEIVLVDDGSSDDTQAVIDAAREVAPVPFIVVSQANAGLAKARNAGIAKASGRRIIFIDDDVLPMPNFIAEHLKAAAKRPNDIVRGAVIMTQSFDRLPPPIYSLKDYSGNFFWTSNVSVPLDRLIALGAFHESFTEYGWEDIELGLRLRFAGVKAVFAPRAVAFHYKPALTADRVEASIAQARAQARTAVQLARLHPHWRVMLATGDNPVQRAIARIGRRIGMERKLARVVGDTSSARTLSAKERTAARALARAAYFSELENARSLSPTAASSSHSTPDVSASHSTPSSL